MHDVVEGGAVRGEILDNVEDVLRFAATYRGRPARPVVEGTGASISRARRGAGRRARHGRSGAGWRRHDAGPRGSAHTTTLGSAIHATATVLSSQPCVASWVSADASIEVFVAGARTARSTAPPSRSYTQSAVPPDRRGSRGRRLGAVRRMQRGVAYERPKPAAARGVGARPAPRPRTAAVRGGLRFGAGRRVPMRRALVPRAMPRREAHPGATCHGRRLTPGMLERLEAVTPTSPRRQHPARPAADDRRSLCHMIDERCGRRAVRPPAGPRRRLDQLAAEESSSPARPRRADACGRTMPTGLQPRVDIVAADSGRQIAA